MKITRKDIMKAVLSVLTTMLFCGCLCYVTMRYFTTYDGDKGYLTHAMLCFAFLFIDVVLCSFYAARNIRVILIKSQWRNTKKWPRGYKSQVAFITKDDCIYNGIYDKDCGVFRAYDGLKFQKDEIVSWCYDSQRDHLYRYFIKYFSNPVRRTDW